MGSYILMIVVTGDQEGAIESLFQCKGWNYEKTGSLPLSREEILQKCNVDKPSNIHQSFTQPFLQQQSQFTNSFASVMGVSEYDVYGKFNGSINMNAIQYHSVLDKGTNIPSQENTQVYGSREEGDLSVSKSIPHNTDFPHFDISNAANKQYLPSNRVTTCQNMEATFNKTDTNKHQNSVSQYTCLTPEFSTDVNTGISTAAETDSNKVHQMEPNPHLDKVVGNENTEATSTSVDPAEHLSNIHKTASNESVEGEMMSVETDSEVALNSEMNARMDSDNSILRLVDHFQTEIFTANDIRLRKCVKWLLNEFDIICKFLKKTLDFELDTKLILPKLEEILAIAKCLRNKKLLRDGDGMKKSSPRDEIELKDGETFKGSNSKTDRKENNEIHDDYVGNCVDEKGLEENDNDPLQNISSTASVTCINTETEANKQITDANKTKHSRERKKFKEKSYKDVNRSRCSKWIKCEILNCHEGLNSSLKQKRRNVLKNEDDCSEVRSVTGNRKVELKRKERGGQRCISGKRQVSSNERRIKGNKSVNSSNKDETAKFRWTVNRNMRMHKYHRKCETVPPDLDADSYSALEKGFYCPYCQFIFRGKNKLILHRRLKNGYCLPDCIYCDAEQQKDVYQCAKCPKCFQTKQMLERHEEKHAKLLRCSLCTAEFYAACDLKFHIQTVHGESVQPTFLCDLCGSKFKERKVLNAHRRFVHSNERPEVCPSCNKCFKTKSQLKNHLVTHKQVSELNLSCEICGKMFLRVATLKDHVRRHKKEFTCYCTICNKGFYRKYGLQEHMRVHTGDKPYDCKLCGFKCALSCNLVKHLKIHHKDSN